MAGPPPRGQLRPSFDAASAASERRTSAATEEEHWTRPVEKDVKNVTWGGVSKLKKASGA